MQAHRRDGRNDDGAFCDTLFVAGQQAGSPQTKGSTMTEFALAPATTITVLRSDLRAMLEDGELRAYRVRANGTMRHQMLYPLASTGRETAEWVSDRVDMDGASVATVARELHVSTAAVRRIMLGLELTEEIEAGEWDGIWTAVGEMVLLADEVAPDARPDTTVTVETEHGEPVCNCAADVLGNNWHTPGCPKETARVAGDACEAEGTTVEELGDALAASVAAAPVRKVRSH